MKVLHIITGNDNGGGAKHVLNICKYSTKCENILGCIGEGYLYNKAVEENVETRLFENKIFNEKIVDFINNNEIDIVNFHGAKAFLMHRFLRNKIKAKTLASVHSDYRYDFLNNKIKHLLFTPLSKYGLKSFDNYMCISHYIKDILDENGFKGEKCIVNNGIDEKEIQITSTREQVRDKYNISSKCFLFVNVSRLHPVKNHEGLIRAFKKLKEEYDDIKLLIVGDGEIKESLKAYSYSVNLDKDVLFSGFVSNPMNILNACDVSIITSFNEGGSPPIVFLESALVKKPVISTKVGDIDINFSKDSTFFINEITDNNIYEKMKEAYLNKNNLSTMGEKIYKEVINDYTMEKFCDTYYSFYKKICMESD